jgi:prepilin-type processing-associated H-X9-DG protein
VVIAIVTVLAAILFPVFAQARAKARQAACLSNIRQMDMGVLEYTQDYDERLPLAATETATGFLNWHNLVDPYVRNKQIWVCPSADLPLTDIYGNLVCHYGLNAFYLNTGVDPTNIYTLNNAPGVALSAPQEPAQTVLLVDTRGIDGKIPPDHLSTYVLPPSQPDADYWGRPDWRHSAGANVALLDGHAKWFAPGGFYAGQTPPDDWFDLQ